ncbi:MAG: periplasmic heavy metal sensor [Thermoanaerobaculia bacterium]
MKRSWLILALLLSVGVNCGLLGISILRHRWWNGMERGDRFPGHEGAFLAERLHLNGETRKSFLELQRALGERVRAGRKAIDEGRRTLRQELVQPAPDRARVDALLNEIGQQQSALERALVDNVLAARELLDEPAEGQYLHFIERFGSGIGGARGHPGEPPPRSDRAPGESRRRQGFRRPGGAP